MLSVAKLTPGQENYYERSVAAGLDDYYAGRGESPGVWTGRGAQALELEGVVARRRARAADPRTSTRTRRRASRTHRRARRITIERIDPITDERRVEIKTLAPVAGFDLVFSPPKSVSLLHALGDEETRRAVNEAHTVRVAGGARLSRGRGMRHPARGRNGVYREHAAASSRPRTSTARAARRIPTCTRM